MTTPAPVPRIRWEPEPAGYAVTEDGFIGPAGLNWRAFRIWRPDSRVDPRPFLTSDLRGQERRQVHGTPDELKAEAERWLEEFISSLGTVFPPEPVADREPKRRPVHLRSRHFSGRSRTVCRPVADAISAVITDDPQEATCKNCLRVARGADRLAAESAQEPVPHKPQEGP